MKKKMMVLSLAVVLIVVAAIGGTMAYFTDTDKAENVFTMGNVKIDLSETAWDANVEAHGNVVPGISYAKNPEVTNTGKNPAWIRVDVTLSDATAFETAALKHGITDLANIFYGHDETKWTRADITRDNANDTLTYSYYYNTVLGLEDSNKKTDPLFEGVKIPGVFDENDMHDIGTDFTITIEAHAIQVSEDFDTVQEAFDPNNYKN